MADNSGRLKLPGITLIPALFQLTDSNLEHYSTKYKVYEDRAKRHLKLDVEMTGAGKTALSYTDDIYDDTMIFFTTEIIVENKVTGSRFSCGVTPLTPVMLRKERVSSTGIIVTPEVSATMISKDNKLVISVGEYIRYEGLGELESTDYIIDDDITGDVIYKRENDRENLHRLEVVLDNLKTNRVYRIRARYKDKLGRYSNYGTVLYTGWNILSLYFPFKETVLEYGRDSVIKVSNAELLIDSPMIMTVYKRDLKQEDIVYNDGFVIDTTKYKEGDILRCDITYKSYTTTFNIIIAALNLEDKIDDRFNLAGAYTPVDIVGTIPTGVSSSIEYDDGYIYDVNPDTNQLMRMSFNKNNFKLTVGENVLALPTPSIYTHRAILKNPLGGLIIIASLESSIMQKVIFVNTVLGFTISDVIDVPHSKFSAAYSGNYFIDKKYLVLYNKETPDNPNKLTRYRIDLLTKELSLDGEVENTNYTMSDRLGIMINDEMLLFSGALDKDKQEVNEVLLVNKDNTVGLKSRIPNPIYNLSTGISRVRLLTLSNGRPAFFIAPMAISSKSGFVEISKNGFALNDKRVTLSMDKDHRKLIKLLDGRYISLSNEVSSDAILFH